MKTYMIVYDLNTKGQNYARLISKIEQVFPCWWHHLESTWIVKSDMTTSQIGNMLKPLVDSNDELLIVELKNNAVWSGFDAKASNWLTQNVLNQHKVLY